MPSRIPDSTRLAILQDLDQGKTYAQIQTSHNVTAKVITRMKRESGRTVWQRATTPPPLPNPEGDGMAEFQPPAQRAAQKGQGTAVGSGSGTAPPAALPAAGTAAAAGSGTAPPSSG